MKIRTKLILLIAIVSITNIARAQGESSVQDLFNLYNEIGSVRHSSSNAEAYSNIEGSPYLNEDFIKGKVVKDSTSYEGVPLRYNAYEDQIEFEPKEGVVLLIANPEQYRYFKIAEKKYIYIIDNELSGFYEILEEGKINFLKRESIRLNESELPKGYQDAKPAEFSSNPITYYITINEGDLMNIRKNKEFIEAIPDNRNAVETFISKHKLKVKKEDDFKKIVAFYNQL